MLVRPPGARSMRNPGRPLPNRIPLSEANRPLLRQYIRSRRSDPLFEAYVLEVREGPAVNGNTNAAASTFIPQPWVTVRDSTKTNSQIGLPVSICDALLKHLLTCATADQTLLDSGEEHDPTDNCSTTVAEQRGESPAKASGDGKSPIDEATSGENSPNKKESLHSHSKLFQLSRLQPIRIECEATGCILNVMARDPTTKRVPTNNDEPEQPIPVEPSRRWIVSTPLEARTSEGVSDNSVPQGGRRRHPWETCGFLELHESLLPHFSAFLADVVTRYRPANQFPDVRSLYSASGGRRFFFDLRDTRWGKRLHISQVTHRRRTLIGVPLEALVSFRARLDTIIQNLKLEEQHTLRSEICGAVPERVSPRGQRRATTSSRSRNNVDANEAVDDPGKETPTVNQRGEFYGPRQRGRDRRRQRIRNFTAGPGAPQGPTRATDSGNEQPGDMNSNRNMPNGPNQWNGGNVPRNSRFTKRIRNFRTFNRPRRPGPRNEDLPHEGNTQTASVQSVPEPAVDPGRVAQLAEASA